MARYNEKVMEHFMKPHNVGTIEGADGVGEVGNPVCGDMMSFYIKVKDNRLEDIKFQTFGCGAAIAVSSMVSDMAKGKTIDEALAITNKDVAKELGGLPANKMHCSNLGADALRRAIEDYQLKQGGKPPLPEEVSEKNPKLPHDEECLCPYCDSSLTDLVPFCTSCGHALNQCSLCGQIEPQESRFCSQCGAKLSPESKS